MKNLFDHEQPTLVFLDELTVLLSKMIAEENGKEKASSFLHWLRSMRIVKNSKIKWVFCSSVGIANFANVHQLSKTLNDIEEYILRPFDKETGVAMVLRLGESNELGITEEVASQIVVKLDYCPPYFLQLMFNKMESLHKIEGLAIDRLIVDVAYERLIPKGY